MTFLIWLFFYFNDHFQVDLPPEESYLVEPKKKRRKKAEDAETMELDMNKASKVIHKADLWMRNLKYVILGLFGNFNPSIHAK